MALAASRVSGSARLRYPPGDGAPRGARGRLRTRRVRQRTSRSVGPGADLKPNVRLTVLEHVSRGGSVGVDLRVEREAVRVEARGIVGAVEAAEQRARDDVPG